MNRKIRKVTSIILVLAIVLTQLLVSVVTASAASSSKGKTVYFKLPAEWGGRVDATTGKTISPAAYTAGGSGEAVPWVGTHMQKVEGTDDIYSYVIPGNQTFIIFNTGMQRDWQTGELALCGGDMLFVVDKDIETKNASGHWEPYKTNAPKVAINTGTFEFVGTKDIVLSRFNSTSGTYKISGGNETPFENGDTITIGEGAAANSYVILTVTATNGTDTVSYQYNFHKSASVTVYAKNNAGWQDVYVHYWGGESSSVWPGVKMRPYEDSDSVFYAELPSKTTNYKLNNNMSGTANAEQTSNLAMQDLVPGVAECYVINRFNAGDTANTGEYTTLEKAMNNTPEEGKPIISVEDTAADLGASAELNIMLENTPALSGYVIEVLYNSNVITPDTDRIDSSITANVKTPGVLYLVYSSDTPADYTQKNILATVPFTVTSQEKAQIKVTANPKQLFADEDARITVPSSNIVSGKVTVGVDKTELKSRIDYASALDSSVYTSASSQALETALSAAQSVYDLVTATQDMVDAQLTALNKAIEDLVEDTGDGNYFYFKNTPGWDEVYAYWWGGTTACPAFPGIKATPVFGTADVYFVELPSDATGLNFNDGSNTDGDKEQTDSITGNNLTIGNIFIPDINDTYEKNNGIRYRGVSEKYIPNKIYFKNVAGWDEVYAYWWGGTTACSAFPGVKAKILNGTSDIYWLLFPEDATGFNFSNGLPVSEGGEQTSSISSFEKGKILIMDLDSKYEKNGGYRYNAAYEELDKYLAVKGDVTGDGEITMEDILVIQKYLAKIITFDDVQMNCGDVTGDGEVKTDDVLTIQKYIAKIITSFDKAA